jgi:glycosyltransferase involved in cell wall biosynthesis
MKLVLFFTYGVSLKRWAELGILKREASFYHRLMEDYGIEVLFVTYGDASDRAWESELKGIKLLPIYERMRQPTLEILGLLQSLLIPTTFRKELKDSDLLKTNQTWGGWVAVLAKWQVRKPLLTRCGYDFYEFSRMRGKRVLFKSFVWVFSYFTYNIADQIHVATNTDRKRIIKRFFVPPDKIHVIPNWINTNLFHPYTNDRTLRLLIVGRLHDQKQLTLLFDAIQNTNIDVDIVGTGPEFNRLQSLANLTKISVTFKNQLSTNQMPQLYNHYAIYVICSKYEGNPKTLLEAMACGCAVIGTDVPGIKDVIEHRTNGLLVPEDPVALREAILRLHNDKPLRERLGRAARSYVLANNTLEPALVYEYQIYKKLSATL